MIDPLKVLVATPTIDGRVECGHEGALIACASAHLFGSVVFLAGVSHITLARNLMVHGFLRSVYDWLVFIDSDISFSAADFRLLMDYPSGAAIGAIDVKETNPEGTTLNAAGQALIVTAEYSRKVDSLDPARFGLGFTRIHREVFQRLIAAADGEGAPRIGQFVNKGEIVHDFFPSGPGFEGVWFGEDTGFFHLCRLCGITPRIEQRTNLLHIGRKVYPYYGKGNAS